MVLDAFAATDGTPAAIKLGKVTKLPPPAIAFIAPARTPAPSRGSQAIMPCSWALHAALTSGNRLRKRAPLQPHRSPHRIAARVRYAGEVDATGGESNLRRQSLQARPLQCELRWRLRGQHGAGALGGG